MESAYTDLLSTIIQVGESTLDPAVRAERMKQAEHNAFKAGNIELGCRIAQYCGGVRERMDEELPKSTPRIIERRFE